MRPSTREPSVSYSLAESDLSSLPAMGCVVQASDAKPDDELLELPLVDSIFTLEDFACAPSRPLPRSSTSAQTSRGTAKGGRGRGGSKVHEAVGPPGGSATTVQSSGILLVEFISSMDLRKLCRFFQSFLSYYVPEAGQ